MPGVDATKKSAAAETVGAACDALNNILCFAPISQVGDAAVQSRPPSSLGGGLVSYIVVSSFNVCVAVLAPLDARPARTSRYR